MQVEFDGKVYYSEPGQAHSCEGCAFVKPSDDGFTFCSCESEGLVDGCYIHQIIWKE